MEMLHVRDNGDGVSGLMALRKLLSIELVNVEKLTEEVNAFMMVDPLNESDNTIEKYQQARTGLLSALAIIKKKNNKKQKQTEKKTQTDKKKKAQPLSHMS